MWPLRAAAVLLFVVGVLPLANWLTRGPGLGWYPSAVETWLTWGGGIAALPIALSLAVPGAVERVVLSVDRVLMAPRTRLFLALVATAVIALSLYFGWLLLGLEASAGDEFAQRWQARLLASGHVAARSEGLPEFFSTLETLEVGGRWFSHFPVGGPAFLALGLLFGVPWLVNPVLAAVAICAVHRFVSRTVDERSARWAAIYCTLSPYLLFMSGSEMNHVPTLAASWIALAALPEWVNGATGRRRDIAAGIVGAAVGVTATIRPYDATLLAVAIGAFQLVAAVRDPALRRSLAIQCLVGAVPVAVVLAANSATTGHPLAFAYDVLNGPEHRPGFHATPLGWVHTPRRGLYAISAYLLKLDMMLLGWPIAGVLLTVGGLAAIAKGTRWDVLLLALLFTTLFGYFAYWGESYFMGPRFMYTVAPVLLIYAARLPIVLRERATRPSWRAAAMAVPFAWILASWALPLDVERNFGVPNLASTAVLARSQGPAVEAAARAAGLTNALVLVHESWHGRLTARLRALGMRPLQAEEVVKAYDACTLERALDAAEARTDLPVAARLESVWLAAYRDPPAAKVSGMTAIDQLALVPRRPLDPACASDLETAAWSGITLAELLPFTDVDASGALAGPVVYARDMGASNERLRARFGGRRWMMLRLTPTPQGMRISFDPYAPTTSRGEVLPSAGSARR